MRKAVIQGPCDSFIHHGMTQRRAVLEDLIFVLFGVPEVESGLETGEPAVLQMSLTFMASSELVPGASQTIDPGFTDRDSPNHNPICREFLKSSLNVQQLISHNCRRMSVQSRSLLLRGLLRLNASLHFFFKAGFCRYRSAFE